MGIEKLYSILSFSRDNNWVDLNEDSPSVAKKNGDYPESGVYIHAGIKREHGIEFQAIELESLIERPAIQDLMALTRGLIQLSDRIAWLSILRAPWCGMTLEDLSALAMDDHISTIVELCADDKITARLSADGWQRLSRLRQALEIPLSQRGRVSLRKNVEAAWLNLSAPACIEQADISDCESYFDLLSNLENNDTHITAASSG